MIVPSLHTPHIIISYYKQQTTYTSTMNTATTTNEPASRRALRSTHRVLIKGVFTAINFLDTSHVIFS